MTKSIDTLVPDILDLVHGGVDSIPQENLDRFKEEVGELISGFLLKSERYREPTLRMSNIGKPQRQLWYELNCPEDAEPLPPEARIKFVYGHFLESLLILLAELAGHKVEGRQDTQEVSGIKGHRDVVINGTVVDVKSASTYAFKKFNEGTLFADDPFGYLKQLQGYLFAAQSDPIVTNKDEAAFLVIEKQLGKLTLDRHERIDFPYDELFESRKAMVGRDEPPDRCFDPEPDGYVNKDKKFIPNGNYKLGTTCSYCAFKRKCHESLRTFLSSKGPVYYTHIEKEPKMKEITNDAEGESSLGTD